MRNCLSSFPCFRISENPEIIHRKALESANSGDFEGAKPLYEESIKLHEKKPENIPLAKVYSDFASLHSKMGNHDEAIECFKKSLKFFEKDGNSFIDMSKVNLKIASCYCEKNELNQASSCIEDALRIVSVHNFPHKHRIFVDIYGDAGDLYMKMHDKNRQQLTSFASPTPIDVENTYRVQCSPASLPSPNKDTVIDSQIVFRTREYPHQISEKNFISKSISCLNKSLKSSGEILLDSKTYEYDERDDINFISKSTSLAWAYKEMNKNSYALTALDNPLTTYCQYIDKYSKFEKSTDESKSKLLKDLKEIFKESVDRE